MTTIFGTSALYLQFAALSLLLTCSYQRHAPDWLHLSWLPSRTFQEYGGEQNFQISSRVHTAWKRSWVLRCRDAIVSLEGALWCDSCSYCRRLSRFPLLSVLLRLIHPGKPLTHPGLSRPRPVVSFSLLTVDFISFSNLTSVHPLSERKVLLFRQTAGNYLWLCKCLDRVSLITYLIDSASRYLLISVVAAYSPIMSLWSS